MIRVGDDREGLAAASGQDAEHTTLGALAAILSSTDPQDAVEGVSSRQESLGRSMVWSSRVFRIEGPHGERTGTYYFDSQVEVSRYAEKVSSKAIPKGVKAGSLSYPFTDHPGYDREAHQRALDTTTTESRQHRDPNGTEESSGVVTDAERQRRSWSALAIAQGAPCSFAQADVEHLGGGSSPGVRTVYNSILECLEADRVLAVWCKTITGADDLAAVGPVFRGYWPGPKPEMMKALGIEIERMK